MINPPRVAPSPRDGSLITEWPRTSPCKMVETGIEPCLPADPIPMIADDGGFYCVRTCALQRRFDSPGVLPSLGEILETTSALQAAQVDCHFGWDPDQALLPGDQPNRGILRPSFSPGLGSFGEFTERPLRQTVSRAVSDHFKTTIRTIITLPATSRRAKYTPEATG